ncbi:hypothetical protein AVEN_250093-1 [Araneus ventricosus]|uniref:Uncharacterized protein n=1 Tax=Araneus ventricosus TaxID=182803 RepID=A0A4Y2VDA6_ARAVE|nr:hypothetical protein AVEN_250093-1 [Araneus ventricosus]
MDPLPVYGPIYTEFGFRSPYLWNRWGDRLENCTAVIGPSRSFEPCRPLRIRNKSNFRDRVSNPIWKGFPSTLRLDSNRRDESIDTSHDPSVSKMDSLPVSTGPYIQNSALKARI